eukprot:1195911-Prorocentrum_minimum.AAC.4
MKRYAAYYDNAAVFNLPYLHSLYLCCNNSFTNTHTRIDILVKCDILHFPAANSDNADTSLI